eukprot:4385893-Amphidinium_carterae.1
MANTIASQGLLRKTVGLQWRLADAMGSHIISPLRSLPHARRSLSRTRRRRSVIAASWPGIQIGTEFLQT